jgi:hypothetical protein
MYSYEDRIRAVKLYGARTCESGIRDQDRSIPISKSMRR